MNKRLAYLAARRRELSKEIEAQRMEVAEISGQWEGPLALAERGLKAVRLVRSHPVWLLAGVTALLALRHTSVAGMAQKGWSSLYHHPFIVTVGLKLFSMVTRSPSEQCAESLTGNSHTQSGGNK